MDKITPYLLPPRADGVPELESGSGRRMGLRCLPAGKEQRARLWGLWVGKAWQQGMGGPGRADSALSAREEASSHVEQGR